MKILWNKDNEYHPGKIIIIDCSRNSQTNISRILYKKMFSIAPKNFHFF